MADDTVEIEFTPVLSDGDKIRDYMRSLQDEQRKSVDLAKEHGRVLLENAKLVAQAHNLPEPTTPQAAARVMRHAAVNLTPNAKDRAASFSAINSQLGPDAPEPIRKGIKSLADLDDIDRAKHENTRQQREAREQLAAYKRTPEGSAERYSRGIDHGIDENIIQRRVYAEKRQDPRFLEDEAQRRLQSAMNTQRRSAQIRAVTPEARAKLKEEGFTFPSDMNPFAKALQNTFKSAASLGMLEAMSGGTAAPLVRAFASNIIAGAILPSAMQALGSAGSGLAKVGGKLASGANSAISGAIGTGAASALGGIGEAGAGILGGAASVALPVLSVAALGLLLAGGATAYMSNIETHQSTLAEQGAAAIGGPAWAGKNSLFNQAMLGSSQKFLFSQDQMAAVGVGLGNLGVQAGQPLRSNADNTALLARATGSGDPNAFTGLVGSLATAGGMSADDITKMIGLLAKQNDLTGDLRVPMDTMVGNLQTLVSSTGGLPVTASSVAGLTAITNKFNNMGKAGQSLAQNVGNVMAPLMGATGVSSMMAENLLGMTPDAFHQAQTSNPALLFNKASTFLQNSTAGMSGYAKQQQAQLLISSLPQIFGSNLSSSNIETLAQAMLGNNGSKQGALTSSAEKILGMLPTDANAVKDWGAKLAAVQTDDATKLMLGMTNAILGKETDQATSLHTIIGLLGRATGQWQGSSNPAILAYETAHGGPPTLVNGVQTNPDGTPYKGPPLGGGPIGMGGPGGGSGGGRHGSASPIGGAGTRSGWHLGQAGQLLIPTQYAGIINAAAKQYGLNPALIAAVMRDESNFAPGVTSYAGAQGLMQLMPGTMGQMVTDAAKYNSPLAGMGNAGNFDPTKNIFAGAQYLREIVDSGVKPTDYYNLGAKYNGGIGAQPGNYAAQSAQEGANVQAWATSEQTGTIGLTGTLTLITPTGKLLGTGTIKAQGSHS